MSWDRCWTFTYNASKASRAEFKNLWRSSIAYWLPWLASSQRLKNCCRLAKLRNNVDRTRPWKKVPTILSTSVSHFTCDASTSASIRLPVSKLQDTNKQISDIFRCVADIAEELASDERSNDAVVCQPLHETSPANCPHTNCKCRYIERLIPSLNYRGFAAIDDVETRCGELEEAILQNKTTIKRQAQEIVRRVVTGRHFTDVPLHRIGYSVCCTSGSRKLSDRWKSADQSSYRSWFSN
jgi:hypothetical protein